jgi:hypothetical protein
MEKKFSGRRPTGRVGRSGEPNRQRDCTEEDLHTKVWTSENCTQEELKGLVPKESRLRCVYGGKVKWDLDDWHRLLRSRYE